MCVIVYLDNILIYSDNITQYWSHIKEVLKQLWKSGLYAKAEKCEFHSDSISGDRREFNHKTKVITNESKIISEMFHNCALNK